MGADLARIVATRTPIGQCSEPVEQVVCGVAAQLAASAATGLSDGALGIGRLTSYTDTVRGTGRGQEGTACFAGSGINGDRPSGVRAAQQ
jgi:hypothetical protein